MLQQHFPLLSPSAGFGWLLRTVEQIWPRFSKHACTAARPLYTRLFFKYRQEQLDWRREQLFTTPPPMLESSVARKGSTGHRPHIRVLIVLSELISPDNGADDTFTMKGQ